MLIRILIIILTLYSSNVFAYQYTDDEGNWLARAKVGATLSNYSADYYLDGAPTNNVTDSKDFFASGSAIEIEGTYFINHHVSFSAALGYLPQQKITWTTGSYSDKGKINMIPVSALVQYNFAPYGEIRPYVGIGYHYTLMQNEFKKINVSDTSGLVVQLGTDWWINKHWGLNFDIKHYLMDIDLSMKNLTGTPLTAKTTVNPSSFSLGVAYRF